MTTSGRNLRRVEDRRPLVEGPLGAFLLLGGDATGGSISLVEHPLAPRALGVPTHANEDEYSFVLEGTVGFELEGETFESTEGDVVVNPRAIPHAFWNPTDKPARILELIVPAGFEAYFAELGEILSRPGPPDLAARGGVAARYGLQVDLDSVGRLAAEHQLDLPS
jgi:quercetin dioxygenase-like cupin family protein